MSPGYSRFTPFLLIFAFLALALVCIPDDGHAQPVPVTKIENADGDSVLTVFEDGGFAAYAGEGNGVIPAEGVGARLMWYPGKTAFRAGDVSSSQWDATNVGFNSVAFGLDTKASEYAATAMGDRTTASGERSTAMGQSTIASGFIATASGKETTASGLAATAMGNETTASGLVATAMGDRTTASGDISTAMGDRTTAATAYSLSMGKLNEANTSADGTLLVAGNGTFGNPSDALVLDQSGNLEISGTLTENSDRRLKTQIQPLGNSVLAPLGEIEPVRFRFKDERTHPSGTQVGLIAQEVQAQFPALVSEGASGHLSVSYSKFTAVLLKGLQDQQSQIQEQRKQIDRLEAEQARVASLRNENDAIKKRLARLEQAETDEAAYAGWGASAPLGGLLALLLLAGGVIVWRRFDALSGIKTLTGLLATGLLVIGSILAAPVAHAQTTFAVQLTDEGHQTLKVLQKAGADSEAYERLNRDTRRT
ncbi:tail fiber domain-containing protein, partial [Longibacter sp.]|uniref:tail fiber domain-containing protein n=1 Tax=Longibacter sp. TaxID=2045415 RepID=UPI003EBF89F0